MEDVHQVFKILKGSSTPQQMQLCINILRGMFMPRALPVNQLVAMLRCRKLRQLPG